jgi:hypothetical protein
MCDDGVHLARFSHPHTSSGKDDWKTKRNEVMRGLRRRIFQQVWWQEASAGDQLERVEARWDGEIVGSLCFVREVIWGL